MLTPKSNSTFLKKIHQYYKKLNAHIDPSNFMAFDLATQHSHEQIIF